ncbi:Unknown protein sequence [Pseudomonas syringae pv. syringae]|nr:Unknown protein sequence [Pseudomonas syringae pv. syringae]
MGDSDHPAHSSGNALRDLPEQRCLSGSELARDLSGTDSKTSEPGTFRHNCDGWLQRRLATVLNVSGYSTQVIFSVYK